MELNKNLKGKVGSYLRYNRETDKSKDSQEF